MLTPDTPHAHINKSISTEPVFYFSREGDDQYLGQSNNSDPGLEPVDAEGFLNELVAQHSLEDKMPAARKWVANDFYEGQMTLATLRLKAGLTQAELAKKVDMPQSSVARLESGRENPSLTRAKKIADVLAVSLDKLYFALEETRKGDIHDN